MEIEIITVGGYDEVGRNMTAVRCGKEIVIFDMGLRLDQLMIHKDVEVDEMHSLDLIKIKAITDDTVLQKVEGTVKAIVCSHGHLDHIGGRKTSHPHSFLQDLFPTPPRLHETGYGHFQQICINLAACLHFNHGSQVAPP